MTGLNIYHYECRNCITDFIGSNLLYCPFCGSSLEQHGLVTYTAREQVTAGWNAIAFRNKEAGFVVKDLQAEEKCK